MADSAHPSRRTLHSTRRCVAVAVTATALLAIPAVAQASDYQDLRSPDTRDAAREAAAINTDLRSPDARDAAIDATASEAAVINTDLRSPDARDAGPSYVSASELLPVADAPSTSDGFDLMSATIGAGVGLLLMLVVTAGVARRGRGPLVRTQRHGV
jgi:hypothetical protein